MKVDIELLRKYSRPGPRYTSYPTALQFSDAFGSKDFHDEIERTNQGDNLADLSLYFHLPFCRQLCYFCGCNMVVTGNLERIDEYLKALKKEIDTVARLVNPTRKVVQLHWGGGTPTYLSVEQITDLFDYIGDRFTFSDDSENSIEIDPRGLSQDHLPALRRVGFNRVSFGVQDFNSKVQEVVNRIQPEELNRWVVEESRALGFDSVNVDLIYGLPYQSVESFSETLEKIIDISPDRLAVFNYAHVPWLKKHQAVMPADALPPAADRLRILALVIERLTEAGYAYIGMDHFAKQNDDLTLALNNKSLHRNFQGYTTRAGVEIYAMGVSSISQLKNVYAQNEKNEREYTKRMSNGTIPTTVGYRLNDDDHVRRYVIMELMCNGRVKKDEVRKQFGVDFDSYFDASIKQLGEFVGDGLVTIGPDGIETSEEGRLVIRNIAMAFDPYLESETDQKFSKTV